MRHRRTWIAVVAALLYLSLGWAAHAQTDQARERASAHFRRGVELFQEGAYRAALVEFERAYAVAPDYRLLYNIGQVKLQLHDYLGATQSYENYLTEGGSEIPPARRNDVEEAFETLSKRVGRVAVAANRDGAEIFIDDQRVGVSPLSTTIAVNIGSHRVLARNSDGASDVQVIDIAGGDLINVMLELKDPQPKVAVNVDSRASLAFTKRAAIGTFAGAGVALVGAVAAGFVAAGKVDKRDKELEKPLPEPKMLSTLMNSANSFAIATDVLAGVALLGTGAGIALWLLDDGSKAKQDETEPAATAKLQWNIGFGTVTVRRRFQ